MTEAEYKAGIVDRYTTWDRAVYARDDHRKQGLFAMVIGESYEQTKAREERIHSAPAKAFAELMCFAIQTYVDHSAALPPDQEKA